VFVQVGFDQIGRGAQRQRKQRKSDNPSHSGWVNDNDDDDDILTHPGLPFEGIHGYIYIAPTAMQLATVVIMQEAPSGISRPLFPTTC
jgi:hypothetical protein